MFNSRTTISKLSPDPARLSVRSSSSRSTDAIATSGPSSAAIATARLGAMIGEGGRGGWVGRGAWTGTSRCRVRVGGGVHDVDRGEDLVAPRSNPGVQAVAHWAFCGPWERVWLNGLHGSFDSARHRDTDAGPSPMRVGHCSCSRWRVGASRLWPWRDATSRAGGPRPAGAACCDDHPSSQRSCQRSGHLGHHTLGCRSVGSAHGGCSKRSVNALRKWLPRHLRERGVLLPG